MKRDWLKKLRDEDGRKTAWVAKKLGVTANAVHKFESGDLNPSSDNIFGLADIFGDVVIDRFREERAQRQEVASDA